MKTPTGALRSALARLRRKLADIAIEAVLIVFAVLVALGVGEWHEERQLHRLPDRVRVAVDLENKRNPTELAHAQASLIAAREKIANIFKGLIEAQRGTLRDTSPDQEFALEFLAVSAAAWRVAQAGQAVPYLDCDRLAERAECCDALENALTCRH